MGRLQCEAAAYSDYKRMGRSIVGEGSRTLWLLMMGMTKQQRKEQDA